jgi:ribosomal-protein-serine acetyltransferase
VAEGCAWSLAGGARLRLLEEGDAEELHRLIVANREHLAAWMPWAAAQAEAETRAFLARARRQLRANDGFQAGVLLDARIVGVAGYHAVDWVNRTTSIGYWLAADRQGQGTMTATVAALARHALDGWGLNRIELRAAVENHRSRALAERLDFRAEATMRKAERIGDRTSDLVVYSLLAGERAASVWKGAPEG